MKKMLKYSLSLALCLSLLLCAAVKAEISENSQSLSLTGVGNARELGGYETEDGRMVKRGVLLRTAKLVNATEEDLERLRSFSLRNGNIYRYSIGMTLLSAATISEKSKGIRVSQKSK